MSTRRQFVQILGSATAGSLLGAAAGALSPPEKNPDTSNDVPRTNRLTNATRYGAVAGIVAATAAYELPIIIDKHEASHAKKLAEERAEAQKSDTEIT